MSCVRNNSQHYLRTKHRKLYSIEPVVLIWQKSVFPKILWGLIFVTKNDSGWHIIILQIIKCFKLFFSFWFHQNFANHHSWFRLCTFYFFNRLSFQHTTFQILFCSLKAFQTEFSQPRNEPDLFQWKRRFFKLRQRLKEKLT